MTDKAETLLEEARMALEPFAKAADAYKRAFEPFLDHEPAEFSRFTVGDLRRARATLDRIGK